MWSGQLRCSLAPYVSTQMDPSISCVAFHDAPAGRQSCTHAILSLRCPARQIATLCFTMALYQSMPASCQHKPASLKE